MSECLGGSDLAGREDENGTNPTDPDLRLIDCSIALLVKLEKKDNI